MPSVYFPVPEIVSGGDTLSTYALSYSWYVKFFHKDTQSAHELAFAALTELLSRRNLIPLIDKDGEYTGKGFRLKDPEIKTVDDGAVQLTLTWDSRRPYFREPTKKVTKLKLETYSKNAFTGALKNYNQNTDNTEE